MRMSRLTTVIVVAVTLFAVVPVAPALAGSGCADYTRPACSIQLSTGITMAYREIGPRGGDPVFLLHGYTDSSLSWERVLPILHRLLPGSDIIVPDLRGHGDTSMPSGAGCPPAPESCFTWRDFAADIIAFMDARHIRRAAIVGHSMGTLPAQELGLTYPDRVSRLVLISTAAAGQEPAVEGLLDQVVEGLWRQAFVAAGYDWPSGVYSLSPAVAAPGFDDFIDTAWVTSAVAPTWFLDQIRRATLGVRLGTWIGPLKQIVATDNTERLSHLHVPTLVLYATQDGIFSEADEQRLIGALSRAAAHGGSFYFKQYGELPPTLSGEQTDLAHNLPWEAPEGVATDIASFLTRGRPTYTLYHTDYPSDIHRVLGEPGRAFVIHEP